MHALIDGDIVAYRCAAVNEQAEEGLAIWQTDQLISRILEDVNATNWQIYLSGDDNFRYIIDPEYKANRRDTPKPRHLQRLREYLVLEHSARLADGVEADDELGIAATRLGPDGVVICSLDKDLLQIPGSHYNFNRRTLVNVSIADGFRNFYEQLLIGDPTDNIRGCPGIGKAKAPKILQRCSDESSFCQAAWGAYLQAGAIESDFIRNAKLLYILRERDKYWIPPIDISL